METRLNILADNNIISIEIRDYCMDVYNDIIIKKELDGNATEVFLTHLAMASQRIKENNIVGQMDQAIRDEVLMFEKIDEVKELTEEILQDSVVKFPEVEIDFLWLHLCNVLNEKGGPN